MARRQRGEGAVFKRGDGRYVGTIDLQPDPATGKRRRKTIYGTSTRDVIRKMDAAKKQLAERGDLPTADQTVKQWLTYWLEDIAAPRVKPGTLIGYRVSVEQYLIPTLGRYRLPQLAPQHIRGLHKAMADRGLSTTTALNAHRVLSSALTDAVRWNRVPRNVASLVRSPSKAVTTRTGLTLAEAIAVLGEAAKDERLGSTWFVALMLGLRQGERLGLRWSHVNLDAGTIDVAWSLQRVPWKDGKPDYRKDLPHIPLERNLILLHPKTTTSTRLIPLPTVVQRALTHRQALADLERPGYTTDHDLVWCHPDGGPINPRTDNATWHAMLETAGVEPHSLHEARNTAATLLFEGGADQGVIKEILGHSTVVMSRSYQRVSQELARRALDDVGDRLTLT